MSKKYIDLSLSTKAGLLWKSMERQPEVQTRIIRLNKEITIRMVLNKPDVYLLANRYDFTMSMKEFFKTVVTYDKEKLEYFIFRIYDSYLREIQYLENRDEQFSMDILFQVIESLAMEKENKILGETHSEKEEILSLGGASLTNSDLEIVKHHIKAFNLMSV